MVPRRLQVGHMTEVEEVEATVGDHQAFAASAHGCPPGRQLFPGNNLLAEFHARILAKVVRAWQGRRGAKAAA
jgi:hypothetical protein